MGTVVLRVCQPTPCFIDRFKCWHVICFDRALVAAGVLAMSLLAATAEVSAAPVLGGQLFWSGGDVTITVEPATVGFTSQLKLFSADPDLFIARNTDVGASLTIGEFLIDVDHDASR